MLDVAFGHLRMCRRRNGTLRIKTGYISFDGNSAYNDGLRYEGWEGHFELVKLNLQNPAVVDYLLDCVKMWIEEFGIDGLRPDVAYCLDHNFMRRLRSFCEELKPGFALIGEVLFGDYNLIVNDEMLHEAVQTTSAIKEFSPVSTV